MSAPAPIPELFSGELTSAVAALRARLEWRAQNPGGAAEETPPPSIPTVPVLEALGTRFGLSRFERQLLLLCAGMELDTRIPMLCAAAQGDAGRTYPTFALALTTLDEPSWDALAPGQPLRHWRMLEFNPSAGQPLVACALRLDERLLHLVKGANRMDERLALAGAPLDVDAGGAATELAASQHDAVQAVVGRWRLPPGGGLLSLAQLVGGDPLSQQLVAREAARELGRELFRLTAESLPTVSAEIESLARLWERERRLLPLALYLDTHGVDLPPGERMSALTRLLGRVHGPVFLATADVVERPGRSHFVVDVRRPTGAEQRAAWRQVLGDHGSAPRIAAELSSQFDFNLPVIHELSGQLDADGSGDAWSLCRHHERRRLESLSECIEPKAAWEDLVLPARELDLLRQIAAQVRQRATVYGTWGFDRKMNRGFGITALFTGDSGTGKTMAAEVLARELKLNLCRIDLSGVVSKYIGETEKNLKRLFDAAESGGTILFFDEADALFGKRSDVRDSHDRYANIEVNYLLQRLESYRGLAILATNRRAALDDAFLRRLRFVVEFPAPDLALRRQLWMRAFPRPEPDRDGPGTVDSADSMDLLDPMDPLDYDRLARLNLTGGNIHSVALNAAFRAAEAGTAVTMRHVLAAAQTELDKLQRPFSPADFHWKPETQVNGRHHDREVTL